VAHSLGLRKAKDETNESLAVTIKSRANISALLVYMALLKNITFMQCLKHTYDNRRQKKKRKSLRKWKALT